MKVFNNIRMVPLVCHSVNDLPMGSTTLYRGFIQDKPAVSDLDPVNTDPPPIPGKAIKCRQY
jgi:hypothetical protein